MSSVKFFELNEARDILDEMLLELDGEETVEIAELWNKLSGDAEDKAIAWAKWLRERELEIKMIDGQLSALKAEQARLTSEQVAIAKLIDRSKGELERQMRTFGLDKVKRPGCSMWFQASPKLEGELNEEELRELAAILPGLVRRKPETFALDRVAALSFLTKGGGELPSALTVNPNFSLRIR